MSAISEPGEEKTLVEKLMELFPDITCDPECFTANLMKKVEEWVLDTSNWKSSRTDNRICFFTISNEEAIFIKKNVLIHKITDELKALAEKHGINLVSPNEEHGKLWMLIKDGDHHRWQEASSGNVFAFSL